MLSKRHFQFWYAIASAAFNTGMFTFISFLLITLLRVPTIISCVVSFVVAMWSWWVTDKLEDRIVALLFPNE